MDNAKAFPFPDTVDRNHIVEGKFSYQFTNNWGMGAWVLYDNFKLDDYAWNDYKAYNADLNDPSGRFQIHPQFLLNAKYGGYSSLGATLFVRYRS